MVKKKITSKKKSIKSKVVKPVTQASQSSSQVFEDQEYLFLKRTLRNIINVFAEESVDVKDTISVFVKTTDIKAKRHMVSKYVRLLIMRVRELEDKYKHVYDENYDLKQQLEDIELKTDVPEGNEQPQESRFDVVETDNDKELNFVEEVTTKESPKEKSVEELIEEQSPEHEV